MSFFESPRFPDCISFGAVGGPTYFTEVVAVASGHEQRNEVWEFGRNVWDVAHGVRTDSDMHELIAFFRAMRGRTHGFRFKDWTDFHSHQGGGGLLGTGVGTGLSVYQMMKAYLPGGPPFDLRKITKPVNGAVQIVKNATIITTGFSIDYTTGQVGFNATLTAAISNITKANPAVVTTSSAHGFTNGDLIFISGITAGMTNLNNQAFTIGSAAGSSFALVGVDSTGFATWSGFGTASKYPQAADTLTWTGEFDVPMRFDTDQMKINIVNKQGTHLLESWEGIPVIELRQ